jgi:hypothetical protein
MPEPTQVWWREDIDALAFYPAGHLGQCVIHRRAFRVLLGFAAPAAACIDYFAMQRAAFERAARHKIQRATLDAGANFHLNSRDIQRAATESPAL